MHHQKNKNNLSFTLKNDFFNEIKNEKEAFSLNSTPKISRNMNRKYNIKSSLFQDKSESTNDFEASKVSKNNVSTNISDIKRNDCSYLSKLDESDKSGTYTKSLIILGLFEINKTKSILKYEYSVNKNQEMFNNINEIDVSTDLESSEKSVSCVCSRSSCFSF